MNLRVDKVLLLAGNEVPVSWVGAVHGDDVVWEAATSGTNGTNVSCCYGSHIEYPNVSTAFMYAVGGELGAGGFALFGQCSNQVTELFVDFQHDR